MSAFASRTRAGEATLPLRGADGRALRRDTEHSWTDGTTRFPIVAEIPFLRSGRDALREAALADLDRGEPGAALARLLADRDDWASGPPARAEDVRRAAESPAIGLREAMALLAYGPVGDYFAYRWSDPTYLSGLRLLQSGAPAAPRIFVEVACGIGHYLREALQRGIAAVGVDVVFSKLWLARRFVAEDAQLVCADVASGLPLPDASASLVFCHDAFYFLPHKARVHAEMTRVSAGPVLVGHAHNRDAENHSAGDPWSVAEYAALAHASVLYDDAELTRAFLEARSPVAQTSAALAGCTALSWIDGGGAAEATPSRQIDFTQPVPGATLRLNPLLAGGGLAPVWPSARYAEEYGPASGYLSREALEPLTPVATAELARRRVLLDLPPRW